MFLMFVVTAFICSVCVLWLQLQNCLHHTVSAETCCGGCGCPSFTCAACAAINPHDSGNLLAVKQQV